MILIEITMKEHQLLFTVGGVVNAIHVESQRLRRRGEGGDELIDEDIAELFQRSDVDGVFEA